ncbi:MAG: 2-polyprenyl-3-methyl-5-hydroxy-6-metoxy-1,4-benzoquinol methylase [Gammaproteobacteria bacterium]|jgi:2-polyprenyl-3-methyl-5-hydroxy-6-metoxy-1,4-benzoquinol methylase
MNWRKVSPDPNSKAVQSFLLGKITEISKGRVSDTAALLRSFVKDRTVLDIGVVAHTVERTLSPNWKHEQIRKAAKKVVGVDILEEPIKELNNRGYDIRMMDATSDADLGERFSRVVIGDVIEHVDSAVALLGFARRHLKDGGKILCSTPNPFFIEFFLKSIKNGFFIANAEHVSWITPTMAIELAHRSDLELTSIWQVQGPGINLARKFALALIKLLGVADSEPFSSAYIYEFSAKTKAT